MELVWQKSVIKQVSSTESDCFLHLHTTRARTRLFVHLRRHEQNMTATEIGTYYKVLAFISLHFLPFPFLTFFVEPQPHRQQPVSYVVLCWQRQNASDALYLREKNMRK